MSQVAVATIDVGALKHNLSVVRKRAEHSKILAVVKANAYGHGLKTVANALSSVDAFAVAHYEEAIALRKIYQDKPIILLQGFTDKAELKLLLEQSIEPVIHSFFQIDLLEQTALSKPINIWLKIDTGMNRLGIPRAELVTAWQRLNLVKSLTDRVRIMSHFADADNKTSRSTLDQINLFQLATKKYKADKSLANSAGLLNWPASQLDWVRPGIMLYGVSPFENESAKNLDLKPVMTLKSCVIAINHLKKGDAVGYGHTWKAERNTSIAIVGIGYGDGYPRNIAENTPVLIQYNIHRIVGRVSMDMICVELTDANQVKIGDEVILWGNGLPVEEIAKQAGTIAYELLCNVTPRVKFESVNSDSENFSLLR